MSLTASGKPAASALMFWDRASNTWTMYAHDMPKLAAGRTYQLWLVTPSAKISAGTFAPDSTGGAHLQANYALAADSLRAVAVTLEPAGGVSQPTGPIVIAGTPILTEGK
jgi:anti-sigma-K factor RskA